MTLSSSLIQRSSPSPPGSYSRGARLVEVAKYLLPRPPRPPWATVTCLPISVKSLRTCPRSRSRTIVPGGTPITRSFAILPWHNAEPPAWPLSAFQCRWCARGAKLSALATARMITDPPSPPSPPSGPPFGTYFSRRKLAIPRPPSPAFTKISTRSTNMLARNGDRGFHGGHGWVQFRRHFSPSPFYSWSTNPETHDLLAPEPHDQSVYDFYGRLRVSQLCPVRADGDCAFVDLAARLVVTLAETDGDEKLRQPDLSGRHLELGNVGRVYPQRILVLPVLLRRDCRVRTVVERDNVAGQRHLRSLRVRLGGIGQHVDLARRSVGEQGEPILHQVVRNAHRLAELLVRRLADADVVVEALPHFPVPVQPAQDRQGDRHLWFLGLVKAQQLGIPLEVTANHQVEQLLATTKFDVRVDRGAVEALHEWVQALVQRDRLFFFHAIRKVVAFQHPLHGDLSHQPEHVEEAELREPLTVKPHLGLIDVDDLADLRQVVLGIGLDLFLCEALARLIPSTRVADECRVIADDQDRVVAEFLELPQLPQRDRVPKMHIDPRRIDPVFH